jgi:MFS family permease
MWLQAASLLGGLVGPALGGILADVAGLRAPFTLTGIAALAAALYGAMRLPETMGLRARQEADEREPLPEPAAARAAQAEVLQVVLLCTPFLVCTLIVCASQILIGSSPRHHCSLADESLYAY